MPVNSVGRKCPGRLRVHVVLAGLVMLLSASPGMASPEDDLLAFLVEQNAAAQDRLGSYSYTIKVQWNKDGDKTPPLQGEGQVKRDGQSRWSVYRRNAFNQTAGRMEEREMRLVVNDKYSAFWPNTGNPAAYQVFHSSVETMDRRTRTRSNLESPIEVLGYCFGGNEGNSFRDVMAKYPTMKFDAMSIQGEDGKTLYQIRRFMPTMDDASQPDAVWTLDPDQGFLVTENIAYRANGEKWIHRSIQAEQIAPGAWFPVSFKEQRYGTSRTSTETDSVTQWRQAHLSDIVTNPEFPDNQFEISALRLLEERPDIVVIRTDLDGSITQYGYVGTNLVPKDLKDLANNEQAINRRIETMSGREAAPPPTAPAESSRDTTRADTPKPPPASPENARNIVKIGFVAACAGFIVAGAIIVKLLRNPSEKKLQERGER